MVDDDDNNGEDDEDDDDEVDDDNDDFIMNTVKFNLYIYIVHRVRKKNILYLISEDGFVTLRDNTFEYNPPF